MKRFLASLLSAVLAWCLLGIPALAQEETPSWKKNTDPVTLEWFVAYDWASHTFDPENNTFDKYLQDETGITIKWSFGNLEKLNMLIATDSLPDIITYDVISSARLTMENGGLLAPLDTLMEEYAPDLQVPQGMIDWYRNENDGHWYALASYFYDIADTQARGGYLTSHNMNFARKDIMEQLGIKPEDMQTKDGFIAALHKVKDANIEYNGQKVIPYIADNVEFLAEQMGADREDPQGNLINIKRTPEYLEALLFLNRAYNEGLMTDEVFTMDNVLRKQMVSSGQIFAGSVHSYLDGKEDLYYSDNDALMMGVGLLKGDGGKEAILSPSATGGWTGTMISKNCEHPDRAIELFAFLTQEEISVAYNYGGIGGYDIIDGEAIIKPERAAERDADPQAFNAKYKSSAQDYFCDWVWIQRCEPTSQMNGFQKDMKEWEEKYITGHCFDDKIFTNVMPDGGTELAAIAAQISEYWTQQQPQIIMAPTPEQATALYEQAIEQLDAMGMTELDEYKNERFHKNKEKMGVEFAWPRNQ